MPMVMAELIEVDYGPQLELVQSDDDFQEELREVDWRRGDQRSFT
jgi:hypothetical protein